MQLILRDDDLSYFAKPADLQYFFDDIRQQVAIHFAIVPKIYTGGLEVPFDQRYDEQYKWIGENKELTDFLKKKIKQGQIKVYQHGFTHQNIGKLFELENKNYDVLYKNLKQGKEYLEKLFDIDVDTIVAPHDRFSKQAISAINKIGYKYISRGFGPLPREIIGNKQYLKSFIKLYKFWLTKGSKYRYPYILDFGSHNEIFTYRIQAILPNQIDNLMNFHKNGVLSITTHYRTMNMVNKEKLKLIISKFLKD